MNNSFVLYCKSYRTDVKRLARLAESIQRFNVDNIPFFISVPRDDIALFKQFIDSSKIEILADEDIISANPAINKSRFNTLPGHLTQQIVKSEFWRLGIARSYLCLDSDAFFIRPFKISEFVAKNNVPYTIIDEELDWHVAALARKKTKVWTDFKRESNAVQETMARPGKSYSFGPNWDAKVWQSLDIEYMQPRKQSFLDLIIQHPTELRWYGEALLRYRAIDLIPSQHFLKVYSYAWQQQKDHRDGIDIATLAQLYCGVIFQSAWEREMDWPSEGGNWLSRLARRLRRGLGRM